MRVRLTLEQAREVRALRDSRCECGRKLTLRQIGARFGISAPAVHHILHNKHHREPTA